MTEGDRLKAGGMAQADVGTDAWWRSTADRAIEHFAASGRVFSSDDVRTLVPDPRSPRAWGARFHMAATRGRIVPAGFVKSAKAGNRSAPVRLWRGAV